MLEIYLTGIKPKSGTTVISGGIAAVMQGLGYSTALYLPAQTGAVIKNGFINAPDITFAKRMDKNVNTYCSYLYKSKKLSQEVYAYEKLYMDKNVIFQDYMNVVNKYECVIVNGQADFSTLFETDFSEEDFVKTIGSPIVLVASMKNSMPEDILEYLNYTTNKGLNIRGIILNECPEVSLDYDVSRLQKTIGQSSGVPVLGMIPKIKDVKKLKPEDWIEYIICRTDLEAIFNVKISKLHAGN